MLENQPLLNDHDARLHARAVKAGVRVVEYRPDGRILVTSASHPSLLHRLQAHETGIDCDCTAADHGRRCMHVVEAAIYLAKQRALGVTG